MKPVVLGPVGPAKSASGLARKIVSFPTPPPVDAGPAREHARLRASAVILDFPTPAPAAQPEPERTSRWDMARALIDRFEARHNAAKALRRERAIRRAIERSKGVGTDRYR